MVKTKIIATAGPASSTETVLRKMMLSGLDVIRLNFSHGTHSQHKKYIDLIRLLNKKYRRHIRILQDLEGYRIRVGRFRKGQSVELVKRKKLVFKQGDFLGDEKKIAFDCNCGLKDLKKGQFIYIDDGNIMCKIISVKSGEITAEVVVGGVLKQNKGVNIPEARLVFKKIKEKDLNDIEFGIGHKVDYIAQSFVRTASDIKQVKDIVSARLPDCKVIAKIESPQAVSNIDKIIDAADGIMIARGDLGICVPIYKVPVIQKDIIKKCRSRKKFVITATQMLEHMTANLWPTRAEVSDVANAIIDGTDFVMLSGETAAGIYPSESVDMMNKIIKFTESSKYYKRRV